MKIRLFNKKLAKKIITMVYMVSLFFVADFVFASDEVVTLNNNIANQASGISVFSFDSDITIESGNTGEIIINIPDLFMADDIDGYGDNHLWDHCSLTVNSASVAFLEDDSSTYLASKNLHFTLDNALNTGDALAIACDASVVDVNPYIAGNYEFIFSLIDNGDGNSSASSYFLTIMPGVGDLFSDLSLSNNSVAAENVEMDFDIILGSGLPSGSRMMISFPNDFIMDDIINVIPNISTFTADSINIMSHIVSASLVNNVFTIELNTDIDAGEIINLAFDSTVLDTNPAIAGQYSISTITRDGSSFLIDAGIGYVNIDNVVNVIVTVQEALILTLDSNNINVTIDPSVNNGEDYSQSTKLQVSTNAIGGYRIMGKLVDSEGDATLKSSDSTILPGDPETDENVFAYIAYNEDIEKTEAELKAEANPAAAFSNISEILDLYDGTVDAIGYSTNTNMQTHTIYYALNINFLTPAGIYSGTIFYTALPTF